MGLDPFGLAGSLGSAAMSARQARKQRDFQERMYKHRYRYTMRDMRQAGLNPILAAGMGLGGGGSPAGAMGQVPDMGRASMTAVESKKQKQTGGLMTSQKAQITAGIAEINQKTATGKEQEINIRKQTELLEAKMPRAHIMGSFDTNVLQPLLKGIESLINSGKGEYDFDGATKRVLDQGKKRWNDTYPAPKYRKKGGP